MEIDHLPLLTVDKGEEPFRFVVCRMQDPKNERELFITLHHTFQRLKVLTQRPNLHPHDCIFSITSCLMEPGRSDYTVWIKDECL